ncbi:MAG: hypothetical protein Q9169_008253 [Polycauliona sp. 2 TL-2023]
MASKYSLLLLSLAIAAKCQSATNAGFCYFCSDNDAPPLCNADCVSAYTELCQGDLHKGLTNVVGDCEVNYFPKASTRNGQSERVCTQNFRRIIDNCGKNANETGPVKSDYCTSSGGGGTWGWNDDGSIMEREARYTITAKGTNQCGQNEHLNHLASAVIQWDDKWVTDADQVVFDANPPEISDFPAPPAPNPLCDLVECDIFDKPYYASKAKPGVDPEAPPPPEDPHSNGKNWGENSGYYRHRVYWAGWSDNAEATAFHNALLLRCPTEPRNFQAWIEGDSHVADMEFPHTASEDHCWCIADAIYDASGGIKLDRKTWCEGARTAQTQPEFSPVDDTPVEIASPPPYDPNKGELRKRYLEEEIGPMFTMVGNKKPDTAPVKPRRARRAGAWF